jgi:hypothetical protein
MLPQSVYPLDLRTLVIAHEGGDVYGDISLHRAGSLSYTVYGGERTDDRRSGSYFSTQDNGLPIQTYTGTLVGGDFRWNTPLAGLMVGGSSLKQMNHITGHYAAYGNAPFLLTSDPTYVTAVYGDYTHDKLRLNAEYRRNLSYYDFTLLGQTSNAQASDRGWYATISYRILPKLEVGTYHSRYYVDQPSAPGPHATHIFDQTVTARYDLTRWSNVKVEGHFMDGYGDLYSAHGFYLRSNPNGTQPKTNMLVVRVGFYI